MPRSNPAAALLAAATLLVATAASAQWINHPTPGLPRNADGTPKLDGPVPRMPDGKPDLSGLWEHDNPLKYLSNIAADLGEELPMKPDALKVYQERVANRGADDPNGFCLPSGPVEKHAVPAPFKILQRPELLVILYESRQIYRQIHLDGRPFPEDPQPAWDGYSVGRWDGDTLIVESMGFNGKLWLDGRGHPSTEQMRVTERFRRPAFDRIELEMTVDDPGAYTKPWTVKQSFHFLPDTDLIEHICEENNKAPEQIPGASLE
jgi:hypothetical protein